MFNWKFIEDLDIYNPIYIFAQMLAHCETINDVSGRGKIAEQIMLTHDPIYTELMKSIEIVKDFIRKHQLIIYGGTAIDMALRLHGDSIYPDDIFPDLDFYSPTNVKHAYDLADILYANGYPAARAINALHMKTMKVDIGDNHFVADISYQPVELYAKIPTLEFDGMRIVHPWFQRIDLHSALAYPFDGAPKEVIFARWNKDISRFNKLAKYYPIDVRPGKAASSIPTTTLHKYVLTGDSAYAYMYAEYTRLMTTANRKPSINTYTPRGRMEVIHYDIEKCTKELSLQDIRRYEPYSSIISERIEGQLINDENSSRSVTIYSTRNKLITINTVHQRIRIVNVQPLLKHYLALHYMHLENNGVQMDTTPYIQAYVCLLQMINDVATLGLNINDTPFGLSVNTYGNSNDDLSKQILLNKLYTDIRGDAPYVVPRNYYPDRKGPQPDFDPESSEFFREAGRIIS